MSPRPGDPRPGITTSATLSDQTNVGPDTAVVEDEPKDES